MLRGDQCLRIMAALLVDRNVNKNSSRRRAVYHESPVESERSDEVV